MDRARRLKSDAGRVGVLVGVGLALGVYAILAAVLISKDGVIYITEAQRFAGNPLGVVQSRSPGYPALLWLAHSIVGAGDSVSSWIHVSQGVTLIFRLLTLVVLYFLGKRLVGATRAFWAVLILAVLPYPAEPGHDVLRDWPALLFLALGLWLLYRAAQRRAWWAFGLVGLVAAGGYLIQPVCAQLILYGLLAAIAVAVSRRRWKPLTAVGLLAAGFAVPVAPYTYLAGSLVPRQLAPPKFNSAPVIASVGGKPASSEALEFEVRQGQSLELAVEASDPQGDPLTLSAASIPAGSRPVYQLLLTISGTHFVTASEDEVRTLLEKYPPGVAQYEGIVYYAYDRPDARPGVEPVHRFWSSAQSRHFYTIDPSEKDDIAEQSASGGWTYEGVAFYAFPPGRQPPEAAAVRRLWSEQAGYLWTVAMPGRETVIDAKVADDGVAWYANPGDSAPAGVSVQGMTLRWQPGQQGDHQFNLIVSDGRLETCQLVRIKVTGPGAATEEIRNLKCRTNPQPEYAGVTNLPGAVNRLFDAVAEDLMVFFLLPWGLGLYYRLRHDAGRVERVLTLSVLAVNIALVLARDAWIGPGSTRRYCLALIALTVFYVPVGLEVMSSKFSVLSRRSKTHISKLITQNSFLILIGVGIAICLPKLLTPLYGDKGGYRAASRWLAEHTRPEDEIAVPDSRLAFYAQRQGLVYVGQVDPRRADYIVKIQSKDAETSTPAGWSREYSVTADARRGKTLVIYRTHRRNS